METEWKQPSVRDRKWHWKAAVENPYFEGYTGNALNWDSARQAIYVHSADGWYRGSDDSGRLLHDGLWEHETFCNWMTKGGQDASRLVNLALLSEWSSLRQCCGCAFAIFISALHVLRIGGCMCSVIRFDGQSIAETMNTLATCAVLFEKVELFVCIVGAEH
eukprot:438282-Amphidinium_carterae.1